MNLSLPGALRAQFAREARAAFPRECCGLIEGARGGENFRALALHPAPNLAAAEDRFLIDPAAHIAAVRAARMQGRAIIGCYHSHPGGTAAPSAADLAGAGQEDFVWLVGALAAPDGAFRLAAFFYCDADFTAMALADLAISPNPGG